MESAGRNVSLAWEVMGIDGVFRTGSICQLRMPVFPYSQFKLAVEMSTHVFRSIRDNCSQHVPHQALPRFHQQYTNSSTDEHTHISKNSGPSQHPTRSSASSRKNENRNAVVRETDQADPRLFEGNKSRS